MSFDKVPAIDRGTYIEAIYSRKTRFSKDQLQLNEMLERVAHAELHVVLKNFDFMASRSPSSGRYRGMRVTVNGCMLDACPGLERWMFEELYEVAGNRLLHAIATKFAEDPYQYRRGWPDITMWNNGEIRFVEVKAPGDALHESQRVIARSFAKPLGLQFYLARVRTTTHKHEE
jgi:hypothetical protein